MTDGILSFPTPSLAEPITERCKLCGVWVTAEFAAAIDQWRVRQADHPSRVEAIRWLANLGLAGELLDRSKPARRKRR
jgi:hypothetical protein